MADRRSGYVLVLVWFRLGILGLILISVLIGIPNRLSSDLGGGHIHEGGCGNCGMGRLSASG